MKVEMALDMDMGMEMDMDMESAAFTLVCHRRTGLVWTVQIRWIAAKRSQHEHEANQANRWQSGGADRAMPHGSPLWPGWVKIIWRR